VLDIGILPSRGGKIDSIFDRRSGREWLTQPAQDPLPNLSYGMEFTTADMAGWDEMMPTIIGGATPMGDGALPDHGEVWSVPWDVVSADDSAVTLEVTGRAMPYRFRRTARLSAANVLRLEYTVEATADVPVQLLWAAHPQFAWMPGARVELPDGIKRVLDVMADPPVEVEWNRRLACLLDHVEVGTGHKVWLLPDERPTWSRLRDPDGGAVTLRWDGSVVRYLGIWFDAEAYAREPVVALEPSTGFYDDLARAVAGDRADAVGPHDPSSWILEVAVEPPSDEDVDGIVKTMEWTENK